MSLKDKTIVTIADRAVLVTNRGIGQALVEEAF
jgi:hypothetical protein